MRVGITLDLKTSLFSSGINQNGIYLGMLYKKLGWDVVLLSIDTDGKAGEELDLLKINNLELCKYADSLNTSFDLIIGEIHLENGAWVGAKAVVCPGVTLRTHSILALGSIATTNLDAYGIYQGNPAIKIRERKIG